MIIHRFLHVGLVDEPTVADPVTARSGRLGQQRREALHPPKHADVIDLDPPLSHELLDIAIGEPEPHVPVHRQDNYVGWNRKPLNAEGGTGKDWRERSVIPPLSSAPTQCNSALPGYFASD